MKHSMNRTPQLSLLAAVALAAPAWAQVDNIVTLVDAGSAYGGNAAGGYGYVERVVGGSVVKEVYTSAFGAGSAFRVVSGVDGTLSSSIVANEGQIQSYYRDNDPTRSVTNPTVFGIITNPVAVGDIPAGQGLWFFDAATTRLPNSSTADPAATKRLYRYRVGTGVTGGTASSIFTTLTTDAMVKSAFGTTATVNISRQGAFSPNGQAIYTTASGSTSGVLKVNPLTGAVTRILDASSTGASSTAINTEPAVQRVGEADRVFFGGYQRSAASPDVNVGGISYVDHDGTNTTDARTYVSAAALADFLETGVGSTDVRTIATDAGGTLYFYEQTNRKLLAVDPQGRLYKLATVAERDAAIPGATVPGASVLRLQTRTVDHATAGTITQVMYAEPSSLNLINGVNVFKPTDFNRDGVEDAADLSLFAAALRVRGTVQANAGNARFDMNGATVGANGNPIVDWKDVKIVQQFRGFADGDSDFSGTLDVADIDAVYASYLTSGKVWTQGEFTGDAAGTVDFDDLLVLAQGLVKLPSVPVLTTAGYTQFFIDEYNRALGIAVPEPTTLAALAGLAAVGGRRRRRVVIG